MKINSYKKKKSSIYEIELDNKEKYLLYDDIILKYELLVKKEINEKELKNILNENNNYESYHVALKFLNTKLRTEKEIRKKLKDYSSSNINWTIDRLKKEGYINNSLYIKSYVNDEINLKLVGPKKILFDLNKLGFKDEEVLTYLNSIPKEVWNNKINKYIKKKIETNHNLSSLFLKQKITQDLINKGFYKEDILSIMDNYNISDDDSIYQKEYNKVKNKLSRKYSGEELEYRIKISLLKKGFKKNSE